MGHIIEAIEEVEVRDIVGKQVPDPLSAEYICNYSGKLQSRMYCNIECRYDTCTVGYALEESVAL